MTRSNLVGGPWVPGSQVLLYCVSGGGLRILSTKPGEGRCPLL